MLMNGILNNINMTLNEFINYLIELRDNHNAGDYTVMNNELVYDVICGEIDNVFGEPILMDSNHVLVDDTNKILQINFVDNDKCI